MMKPTIHHNGTSAADLLEQNIEAARRLRLALMALASAAPHARDYYLQGDFAFAKAVAEHEARRKRLEDVLSDLEALIEHVSDEQDRRSR